MNSNIIPCPNCNHPVSISEAFRAEIEFTYRSKLEAELRSQKDEMESANGKKLAIEKEKIRFAVKEENTVELEDLKALCARDIETKIG